MSWVTAHATSDPDKGNIPRLVVARTNSLLERTPLSSLLDPYIPPLIYLGIWGIILLLGYLLKADKHGILLKPYYFMLKTVVFNSWMERIGGRFRRFWLTFFDLGAALGLGLLIFALYTFTFNIVNLLYRTKQAGPTLLIIPL